MSQESLSLSHASPRIGGLLLAAGLGRRFDPEGKSHKLLARLPDGQSLVRVSARALLPWVDRLTVVVGTHNTGIARELADLPVHIVVCAQSHEGPGASLRYGLNRVADAPRDPSDASSGVGAWLIALADMPFIAPSTYALMRQRAVQTLASSDDRVWRPVHAGKPGHPVAVTAGLVHQFLCQDSDPARGLAVLWRGHPGLLREQPVEDAGCVRDVDYPTDLR